MIPRIFKIIRNWSHQSLKLLQLVIKRKMSKYNMLKIINGVKLIKMVIKLKVEILL